MKDLEVIKLNNIEYVKKDSVIDTATKLNGMDYVCVRTHSAGCHCGYLESKNGQEVVLINARRLWYWEGASTLSQIAMEGVKKPDKCKFPCEVDRIILSQAIEIMPMRKIAQESIKSVKVWAQ